MEYVESGELGARQVTGAEQLDSARTVVAGRFAQDPDEHVRVAVDHDAQSTDQTVTGPRSAVRCRVSERAGCGLRGPFRWLGGWSR